MLHRSTKCHLGPIQLGLLESHLGSGESTSAVSDSSAGLDPHGSWSGELLGRCDLGNVDRAGLPRLDDHVDLPCQVGQMEVWSLRGHHGGLYADWPGRGAVRLWNHHGPLDQSFSLSPLSYNHRLFARNVLVISASVSQFTPVHRSSAFSGCSSFPRKAPPRDVMCQSLAMTTCDRTRAASQ